ncbi:MAG: ComEA family DNA-binding protein [Clostridia bacterium]
MIRKKSLKIILAVLLFIVIGSFGMIIEKFEKDSFIVETVTQDEYADGTSEGASGVTDDGRININTATAEELIELDGIGEKLAQRIIDYRVENGDFDVIEELMLVAGISEKTFAQISDKICVE